ncbi:MAG: diacylglycerol kinase family protein [Patescibacteria group bacterium]
MKQIFSFKKLIHSFKNGSRGIKEGFVENNFRLMTFLGVLAVLGIAYLPLERWEMVIIIMLIGIVVSIELINSQFERVLDIVKPTYDDRVKNIKDIAAGAVLVISATALIVGLIIFLPYIIELLN